MISLLKTNAKRPYWHVDAKWVCGILLFFALGAALLFFNLSKLTERDHAVTLSATIIANLFSKEGLDDGQALAEFRQKAAQAPGDTVAPIEQFPALTISKQDALTLGPRELRIKIFRQMTEPIYDKGVQRAATQFAQTPTEQKEFTKNATLLGTFTHTTHDMFRRVFVVAFIVSLIFLAGIVFFSGGWGRLLSPAVVFLLVSPLGAAAGLLLAHSPQDDDAPLAGVPTNIAHAVGNSLGKSYLVVLIIGAALLLAAIVGKIVSSRMRTIRSS